MASATHNADEGATKASPQTAAYTFPFAAWATGARSMFRMQMFDPATEVYDTT